MKNEKLEKQASSEIAERLKKYKAEIFGNKPILIGGIGWQHGDLIQLLELAERDTREHCAQQLEELASKSPSDSEKRHLRCGAERISGKVSR